MKKSVFLESCGVKKKYLKGGAENFFSHPLRIFIRENTILDPLGTVFEGQTLARPLRPRKIPPGCVTTNTHPRSLGGGKFFLNPLHRIFNGICVLSRKSPKKPTFCRFFAVVGPSMPSESLSRSSKQVQGIQKNHLRAIHEDTTPLRLLGVREIVGASPTKTSKSWDFSLPNLGFQVGFVDRYFRSK